MSLPQGLYPDPTDSSGTKFYKTHRSAYTWVGCFTFCAGIAVLGGLINTGTRDGTVFLPPIVAGLVIFFAVFLPASVYTFYKFKWSKIRFDTQAKTCSFVTGSFPFILCKEPCITVPMNEIHNGLAKFIIYRGKHGRLFYELRANLHEAANDPQKAGTVESFVIIGSNENNRFTIDQVYDTWNSWLSSHCGTNNNNNSYAQPAAAYSAINMSPMMTMNVHNNSSSLAQPMMVGNNNYGYPTTTNGDDFLLQNMTSASTTPGQKGNAQKPATTPTAIANRPPGKSPAPSSSKSSAKSLGGAPPPSQSHNNNNNNNKTNFANAPGFVSYSSLPPPPPSSGNNNANFAAYPGFSGFVQPSEMENL